MNRRSILQTFLTGFLSASITSYAAGKDLKSLIVFYSRSGHTETLANTLAKLTGAETIRIESTSPYPTDYDATIERFKAERAANTLPAIYPIEKDLNRLAYVGRTSVLSNSEVSSRHEAPRKNSNAVHISRRQRRSLNFG